MSRLDKNRVSVSLYEKVDDKADTEISVRFHHSTNISGTFLMFFDLVLSNLIIVRFARVFPKTFV